jgi:DNA-binding winged helix-turn-helix (wHTH) protein
MVREILRFAEFELDRSAYELRSNGRTVRLERKPLDLLFLLIERRGELVTRDEILERVWGRDVFVDTESSINTAVRKIRRALADDALTPRFLVSVPGKGYRFVAAVPIENSSSTQVSASSEAAFVGRDREMSELRAAVDEAIAGAGRLFLVSGEAGIGKTRLAEQLADYAGSRGVEVLWSRCWEGGGAPAYWPWIQIIRAAVAPMPAAKGR